MKYNVFACPNCGRNVSPDQACCPYCQYALTAIQGIARTFVGTQIHFPKLSAALAILRQPTTLLQSANVNAAIVSQLQARDTVKLGEVKKGKQTWVKVSLPDGRSGFIPGITQVFRVQKLSLEQESAEIHAAPDAASAVVQRISQPVKFYWVNSQDGWMEVRDLNGKGGYLNAQTKIKILPYMNREVAIKNIRNGALWCFGGILVTAISYSAASAGGTYIIAWGAILFGGIQFLKGLGELAQAED